MKAKLSWMITAVVLFFGACDVTAPIYNTPHPSHAKITLTTDWTQREAGLELPPAYSVVIGEYSASLTGTTNAIDHLFAPGNYMVYVYNQAAHISVSGTTATADYASGTPGWFFSSATEVTVAEDTDYEVTSVMQQQVHELTLLIELTGGTADRAASITGTLSGVARTFDIDSGMYGSPSDVAMTFTKITEGADAGKWTATARLLGVVGAAQRLTGAITFVDGEPGNITLNSDLTAALANFNNNKNTSLTLGGTVVETPTGAGFIATITGWENVTGGTVIAD